MKADLHNHTTCSDGVLTVQELALFKKRQGFDIIAVTDHDSVNACESITQEESLAIPVLIGVELSTYYRGENIHLLGYFKGGTTPSPAIRKYLSHLEECRKTRLKQMLSLLKENDIHITYQDVMRYADGAAGRAHVAKAIQEKYHFEWKYIFEKYIGDDAPCYVPTEYLDFKVAVHLLHENNALAVLAHPHYIQKNNIEELISFGVDGIEIYYPTLEEVDRKRFLHLAEEHSLFVTGGSDFHEEREKEEERLSYGVSGKYLEAFLKELEVNIS